MTPETRAALRDIVQLVADSSAGQPLLRARAVGMLAALGDMRHEAPSRDTCAMVREFHLAMGAPVADQPQVLDPARTRLRLSLILEEVGELVNALGSDGTALKAVERAQTLLCDDYFDRKQDIVEAADALADIEYVTAGTAVEMGIPLGKVLAEVHRSNLSKRGGVTRADGKIMKSASYQPPRIAEILGLGEAPPFEYPEAVCDDPHCFDRSCPGTDSLDVNPALASVETAAFLDPKGRGAVNGKLATVETEPSMPDEDTVKRNCRACGKLCPINHACVPEGASPRYVVRNASEVSPGEMAQSYSCGWSCECAQCRADEANATGDAPPMKPWTPGAGIRALVDTRAVPAPADDVERFERETAPASHSIGARVEVTTATGTRIGKVVGLDQVAVDLGGGVVQAFAPAAVRSVA